MRGNLGLRLVGVYLLLQGVMMGFKIPIPYGRQLLAVLALVAGFYLVFGRYEAE